MKVQFLMLLKTINWIKVWTFDKRVFDCSLMLTVNGNNGEVQNNIIITKKEKVATF